MRRTLSLNMTVGRNGSKPVLFIAARSNVQLFQRGLPQNGYAGRLFCHPSNNSASVVLNSGVAARMKRETMLFWGNKFR